MVNCENTSFAFPMQADVYYANIENSPYGGQSKVWVLDRTIAGNFIAAGAETKEELVVNVDLSQESLMVGRVKKDIRLSERQVSNALTSILITNIRTRDGIVIYSESAGPRDDEPTIYEVATQQPVVGPFGSIEHYRLVLRRSENQGVLE